LGGIMNTVKKSFKAIIFDMDGTIIDTENVWNDAVESVIRAQGVGEFSEKQKQVLESLSGVEHSRGKKILHQHFDLSLTLEEYMAQLQDHVAKKIPTEVTFKEGFLEFHKLIKEHNIPHAIATNCDGPTLKNFIKHMKLDELFGSRIFNIDHVGNRAKPDPDLFLYAAEQLGVKPEDCLVFEDSLPGFLAAKSAGMTCIGLKNNNNHAHLHHTHNHIETYHHALDALHSIGHALSDT
jgi:beta-phosphoglucomutase